MSGVDSIGVGVNQANLKVDEVQDARTLTLADLLSADGFGRGQPFQPFGADSPGDLMTRRPTDEARALISLANKVLVHPKVSATSKKAATAMREAALALQRADGELTLALDARIKAVTIRNQTLPQWQKALSRLRAAIRFGDFEEGRAVCRTTAAAPRM